MYDCVLLFDWDEVAIEMGRILGQRSGIILGRFYYAGGDCEFLCG